MTKEKPGAKVSHVGLKNEKGHVLLIDDAINFSHVMKTFLEKEGYRVSWARSHKEATRILETANDAERCEPDVILSDYHTSDADYFSPNGVEFLEHGSHGRLPVIGISGSNDANNEMKKACPNDVLGGVNKSSLERYLYMHAIENKDAEPFTEPMKAEMSEEVDGASDAQQNAWKEEGSRAVSSLLGMIDTGVERSRKKEGPSL